MWNNGIWSLLFIHLTSNRHPFQGQADIGKFKSTKSKHFARCHVGELTRCLCYFQVLEPGHEAEIYQRLSPETLQPSARLQLTSRAGEAQVCSSSDVCRQDVMQQIAQTIKGLFTGKKKKFAFVLPIRIHGGCWLGSQHHPRHDSIFINYVSL